MELTEKAKSKAQQRFMAMVAAGKIKSPKGLSKEEARKMAQTKHSELPEKINESISDNIFSFKHFLTFTS